MNILLPLDGAPLAERAIDPASAIAQRGAQPARITLLSCVRDDALRSERAAYLESVRQRPDLAHVQTQAEVVTGDPRQAILDYTARQPTHLIVLATHVSGAGASGTDSIAADIARQTSLPTLIIRPTGWRSSHVAPLRMLALLDGSLTAEAALGDATEFARLFHGELYLAHVMPNLDDSPQEQARRQSKAVYYLESIAERVRRFGTPAHICLTRGEVPKQCARLARELDVAVVFIARQTKSTDAAHSVAAAVFYASPSALHVAHPFDAGAFTPASGSLPTPTHAELRAFQCESDQDEMSARDIDATDVAAGLLSLSEHDRAHDTDLETWGIAPTDAISAGD